MSRRLSAAGAVLGLITLGLVVYLLGGTDLLSTLGALSPRQVAVLVGLGLVPLGLWGGALWLVLGAVGAPTSRTRSVLLFGVSLFFNSLTPFGQTGGAPLSSAIIAHATRAPYERALAGIASLSAVNTVEAIGLWLVGSTYLIATGGSGTAETGAAAAGVTLVVTLALGLLCWRARDRLAARVTLAVAWAATLVARAVPRWSPPTRAAVADRVEGFVVAVERLAASRRHLGAVAGLALAGQLAVVAVLYLALEFFAGASVAVVLVVIPLSRAAAVVPTPGGIGSTEAALTGLLITLPVSRQRSPAPWRSPTGLRRFGFRACLAERQPPDCCSVPAPDILPRLKPWGSPTGG
jgi:Uncharacterised protein family (UPF0104).